MYGQVPLNQADNVKEVHRKVHLCIVMWLIVKQMGREWMRGEGGVTAEFGFRPMRAGGKGRARRDDGVCLSAS